MTAGSTPPVPPVPPAPPALAAAETATLLDRLIYEQVLACIDLDELFSLEQSLTLLTAELDGVDPDRAAELARAMLDRALRRLPDDVRRYLHTADWLRCEHCEEEARAARAAPSGPGSSQRRSTRFKA